MGANTNEYTGQRLLRSSYLAKNNLKAIIKDYVSVLKLGIVMPNLLMAITGIWLAASGAAGFFSLPLKTIFFSLIGVFMILASGTSFNNYFDRDIDPLMTRTQNRALAQGRIPTRHVLWLSIFLLVAGLGLLLSVYLITAFIAFAGWIGYTLFYTVWLKRKHWLNTLVGSFSGAVPPVIGWSAVNGHLGSGALILFFIMFLWQPPHFYAIAIKRREEYERAGIPMLPVVKGFETTKKHIIGSILLLIPVTILLYIYIKMNIIYVLIAITLGLGWLLQARWDGAEEYQESAAVAWSQKNFFYSLFYLVVLMAGMFIGSF